MATRTPDLAPDGSDPRHPWHDALARARADLAANRLHDLDDVLRDLDADAAALEAEHKPPVVRTSR